MGITVKDINNFDEKRGIRHGYQEWHTIDKIWFRGTYKHGLEIGYEESNFMPNDSYGIGDEGTKFSFYIR